VMNNIGGGWPGAVSFAGLGQPARYSLCLAEREDDTPWPPLHVELGYRHDQSTVTVMRAETVINVTGGLEELASVIGSAASLFGILHSGRATVILSPFTARRLAGEGLTRADVRRELYRRGRLSAEPRGHAPPSPHAALLPAVGSSPRPGDARYRAAGGEPWYHGRAMTTPTVSTRALAADVDPVKFEVIRNALLAITEEMGATLRRAAYSTNIKTRGDFSCAFFDRDLRTIAQAFAQPSHLGSLAHIVPRPIGAYGADRLAHGDGILINDPYLGGVHLNDITLITPVFHEGALFGYVANIAHHVDVGGGAPGSIGVSSEIYQEGLVIPPVRFVKGGQIDPDIFALIRSNFRGTREISGDFRAQTAANRLGALRIEALVAQHGAATLAQYLNELLLYTEQRTRGAFAQFHHGRCAAYMLIGGDGVTDEPVKLAAIVTNHG